MRRTLEPRRLSQRASGKARKATGNRADDVIRRGAEQWTELGNAHRLIHRYGANSRYVHPLKAWFIWDGIFWRRDDDGEIMRRAEATIEALFDEAKEIADEAIREAFRKFALKSQTNAQLWVLSPDDIDADPMLLGVLNGTVDLNTGEFR